MGHGGLAMRAVTGAAAGLTGTMAMYPLRVLSQKHLPQTVPPMRQEPGEYMVERAESLLPERVRERVPDALETAAAQSTAMGYGATFGAIYGALNPREGSALVDGTVLGLAAWAAGYLGWLPALGLMPPVNDQEAGEVAGPIARHVIYGIATVAAYRGLRRAI